MGMAMGFAQMLDKCTGSQTVFADRAQTRQVMHDMIAMSVVNGDELFFVFNNDVMSLKDTATEEYSHGRNHHSTPR